MAALLSTLDLLVAGVRLLVLAAAILAGAAALLDHGVRRRRINPFGRLGRITRRIVNPLLAPFERRLVLAGRPADNAGWWMVGAVVVGGLLVIALLDFLRDEVARTALAANAGPRGILILATGWAFSIVRIALLIRVFSSWFRVNPYSRWMRVVHGLTEWMLRPIRQLIPPIGGMLDLSPLIAYFLLGLVEGVLIRAL